MKTEHHYRIETEWTGNRGTGTSGYRDYGRDGLARSTAKVDIPTSADRTFHGDAERWNPEELLIAALSECHMLSFLHVAVLHGVVVTAYTDDASGRMRTHDDGSGEFIDVTLRPRVTVSAPLDDETAAALHHEASSKCFIARSVDFPVLHEPTVSWDG